ncbi:hypothetical protein LDENG_00080930 [Lucifuga dentata]|nr:hypothetical protein LDENG_00080930 [Lucifuga dentata]
MPLVGLLGPLVIDYCKPLAPILKPVVTEPFRLWQLNFGMISLSLFALWILWTLSKSS